MIMVDINLPDGFKKFRHELQQLMVKHEIHNAIEVQPDILAAYVLDCLVAMGNAAAQARIDFDKSLKIRG